MYGFNKLFTKLDNKSKKYTVLDELGYEILFRGVNAPIDGVIDQITDYHERLMMGPPIEYDEYDEFDYYPGE